MKIVKGGGSVVKAAELVEGCVYRGKDSDVLFIFSDEGIAVDLDDGCQWTPEEDEEFVAVPGHFVVED